MYCVRGRVRVCQCACAQHIAMKRVIERNKKVEAVSAISPEKRIFFPFIIVQTRY